MKPPANVLRATAFALHLSKNASNPNEAFKHHPMQFPVALSHTLYQSIKYVSGHSPSTSQRVEVVMRRLMSLCVGWSSQK